MERESRTLLIERPLMLGYTCLEGFLLPAIDEETVLKKVEN